MLSYSLDRGKGRQRQAILGEHPSSFRHDGYGKFLFYEFNFIKIIHKSRGIYTENTPVSAIICVLCIKEIILIAT